jgi:hypothetical protein
LPSSCVLTPEFSYELSIDPVCGKGETEKNHRVPLNGPTITALANWQPERERIAGAATGAGPLLLSAATGRPLTRQSTG